jgi:hypothetical protein
MHATLSRPLLSSSWPVLVRQEALVLGESLDETPEEESAQEVLTTDAQEVPTMQVQEAPVTQA